MKLIGRYTRTITSLCFLLICLVSIALCKQSIDLKPQSGLAIKPEALWKTGQLGDNLWMLPNGRAIAPLGNKIWLDRIPLGLAVSLDGKYIAVTNVGPGVRRITLIDAQSEEILQQERVEQLYNGIIFSPDSRTLYASGGSANKIYVYQNLQGYLAPKAQWELAGVPTGIALSSDGSRLFVVTQLTQSLYVLDADDGDILGQKTMIGEQYGDPYMVAVSPDGKYAYVSCQRGDMVAFFDVSDPSRILKTYEIKVGRWPEALELSSDGTRLYVTCTGEDTVEVIDTITKRRLAIHDLRPYIDSGYGSYPNALAFSPDGNRIYIAQASDNKVSVLDLNSGELIGAIPAGWYPTSVAISPDGRKFYIANAKGIGSGPKTAITGIANTSFLSMGDIPSDDQLAEYAQMIHNFNHLPGNLFTIDQEGFENPIPLTRGGETPIRHVFFVIRENKTYDALLGDYPGGDGEPSMCLVCDEVTVNLRRLVTEFAAGDNYYSNADNSLMGHSIVTSSIVSDFVEKMWPMDRKKSIELDVFKNPSTFPKKDMIFQNCLRHNIDFKVYGEAVGAGKDWLILDERYFNWGLYDPPFYYMFSKDINKIQERIEDWEQNGLPTFVLMLLPNDHAFGATYPFPTYRSMVADNDEATGYFIDWLSKSPYWESSVAFIIEDDPQQGHDHIDAHRSLLLVVSPWVKRGYMSPVHYCEANIHATIEYILGMEPLSIYDSIAQPMYDLFTNEPDFSTFDYTPRTWPEEYNPPGTKHAEASKGLNFLDPDSAEGLQQIIDDYNKHLNMLQLISLEKADIEELQSQMPYHWNQIYQWVLEIKQKRDKENEKEKKIHR